MGKRGKVWTLANACELGQLVTIRCQYCRIWGTASAEASDVGPEYRRPTGSTTELLNFGNVHDTQM